MLLNAFIALITCSTCFGHLHVHHHELETIRVLLPQAMSPGWGKLYESHNFPHPGHLACCSAPSSRPPATKALHTICGNNTSIVSSSWWWTCPKHVEQIIIAVKHSLASSWSPILRLYYDARANIHQIALYLYDASFSRSWPKIPVFWNVKTGIYLECEES